jgi:hypothetical protein
MKHILTLAAFFTLTTPVQATPNPARDKILTFLDRDDIMLDHILSF